MALIVEDVRAVDSDETFAKYMAKCDKLLAAKKKKAKGEFPFIKKDEKPEDKKGDKKDDKEVKKEEKTEAGVVAAEVVASLTEKPNQELPNTIVPTENLAEKIRKVMGESVTVNNVKMSSLKK